MKVNLDRLTHAQQAYFEVLIKENYQKLYRVAYHHLRDICVDSVEEVVQETFYRACKNFNKMINYESPEAWLIGTCHHVALDMARYYMRQAELTDHLLAAETEPNTLDYLLPNGTDPVDRLIANKIYVDRDTAEEVAYDLGKKPAAIRQRISRLRRQLKRKLKI